MIILIAQIVLGIIVFVYIGDIQEASSILLKKLWDDHDKPANTEFWNTIQSNVSFVLIFWFFFKHTPSCIQSVLFIFLFSFFIQLQCCGLSGPAGYLPNLPPDSCCASNDRPKDYGSFVSKLSCTAHVYTTGCAQALNEFVQVAGHTLGAVALGVAAIEVILKINLNNLTVEFF